MRHATSRPVGGHPPVSPAGTPDDVAAAVAFLAGQGAGHLTGQVLHVNGGAYLGR